MALCHFQTWHLMINLINSNWCSSYRMFFVVPSSADPEMASPFTTSHLGLYRFLISQFWGLYAADNTCQFSNTKFKIRAQKYNASLKLNATLVKNTNNNVSNFLKLFRVFCISQCHLWERSGSVLEYLTRDRGAAGSSLTGVTALCPLARHGNPSLVLVEPR